MKHEDWVKKFKFLMSKCLIPVPEDYYGIPVRLTAREYALLEYLMRNAGRVLSRTQVLEHVWDDAFDPVGNVVEVLIRRVRRRIVRDGVTPLIHTVRGHGYLLAESSPADGD